MHQGLVRGEVGQLLVAGHGHAAVKELVGVLPVLEVRLFERGGGQLVLHESVVATDLRSN